MTRLCGRFRVKEFDFHSWLHANVLRICRRAQARFRLFWFDVSLWQGDTYILGAHPQDRADLQKVLNVGLCAGQITFAAKNLLDTSAIDPPVLDSIR